MDWQRFIEQFGIAVALIVLFFIPTFWFFARWIKGRDERQEQNASDTLVRLGVKLDERERDLKSAHEAHIGDLRSIVVNNTTAVQELTQTLKDRPCLHKGTNHG